MRIGSRVVDVRPGEGRAVAASFAFFFFVLSSYFILRPIRDATAIAVGVRNLPWLWTGTLAATVVCNPLFSALVARFPARRFIPYTYQFFAANILAFYAALRLTSLGDAAAGSPAELWIGRVFYVWTSVFNLFVVSVFWCFMADVFRSEQAKRLFGFIGVGGTLGSIAGSAATAILAQRIGTVNLLLASLVLLELAVAVVVRFPAVPADAGIDRRSETPSGTAVDRRVRGDDGARSRTVIGGSAWAGIHNVLRSPYLLGISVFLILYTAGNTILYFAQTDIIGRAVASRAARTQLLAEIEFAAQTLTVVTQFFFTGRIIRWVGLAAALALQPALSVLGFGALGSAPVLAMLVVFVVLRRGTNFAITNPAMEVLFTVVSREDKYKAKSFIETFVYRGGDQISAWTFAGLSALGLGLAGISWAIVPVCAVWLALGLWLGRRQATLATATAGRGEPAAELAPVPAT